MPPGSLRRPVSRRRLEQAVHLLFDDRQVARTIIAPALAAEDRLRSAGVADEIGARHRRALWAAAVERIVAHDRRHDMQLLGCAWSAEDSADLAEWLIAGAAEYRHRPRPGRRIESPPGPALSAVGTLRWSLPQRRPGLMRAIAGQDVLVAGGDLDRLVALAERHHARRIVVAASEADRPPELRRGGGGAVTVLTVNLLEMAADSDHLWAAVLLTPRLCADADAWVSASEQIRAGLALVAAGGRLLLHPPRWTPDPSGDLIRGDYENALDDLSRHLPDSRIGFLAEADLSAPEPAGDYDGNAPTPG